MTDFQNVLITGCNRGLGLEFVRQLSSRCERIYATCRSPEQAAELSALVSHSGHVEVVALDVTNSGDIAALADRLDGTPLDLLINNAGVGIWATYPISTEDWERVLRINSIAPLKVAEAFMPNVAASRRKLIANITSKMGSMADNTSGGSVIYRSSKAAMNAAMRSFALDHADRGIISLLLHPGWVRTDMGGPNGLIDSPESIAGMMNVIDRAGPSANGGFFDYAGQVVPW